MGRTGAKTNIENLLSFQTFNLTFIDFVNGEIEQYGCEGNDNSSEHGGRHFDRRERTNPGCYAGKKQVSPNETQSRPPATRNITFSFVQYFDEYAFPLSLFIAIFKSRRILIFLWVKRKICGRKRRVDEVVGSRDVDWYHRSIIEENNKVEWTSNMAGSTSQVSKQAFHETYELKEELGK